MLLFDVERVITKLDFESKEFTFVLRQYCIEELGNISPDIFVDACILSGTALLPSLPALNNAPAATRKQPRIRQVVDLMKTNGHTGISVCHNFQDDPTVGRLDYLDRYRRSRLAVKHQLVLTQGGKVEPFDAANVPNDVHEVIGQRLPDELYYYLSRGAIGARVLNQLTTSQIYEQCPVDGGESDVYRSLVSEKLNAMRASSLSLLSYSLTRVYQHRNIELFCWFEPQRAHVISIADMPSPRDTISSWNVHDDVLKSNLFTQVRLMIRSLADEMGADHDQCSVGSSRCRAPSALLVTPPSPERLSRLATVKG